MVACANLYLHIPCAWVYWLYNCRYTKGSTWQIWYIDWQTGGAVLRKLWSWNVVSPVDVEKYEQLLVVVHYNEEKMKYLVDGLCNGFSIGYEGETSVQHTLPNLVWHVGSKVELWNKVMKEVKLVKLKRYAGPYRDIPFENYIQSLIGLVPNNNRTKPRLIFHLSYPGSSR